MFLNKFISLVNKIIFYNNWIDFYGGDVFGDLGFYDFKKMGFGN